MSRFVLGLMAVLFAVALSTVMPCARAQGMAPAPSPAVSDGTSIDQGIAYVLMFVALLLTYLIHPNDAFSYNFF